MNNSIGSVRPAIMSKYLSNNNFNVFTLSFKKQKDEIEFNNNLITLKNHNKLSVSRLSYIRYKFLSLFALNSLIDRSPDYYWIKEAQKNADLIIQTTMPKYIISTYPDISALLIGFYLSKKYNIAHIVDIRDGLSIEPLKSDKSVKYSFNNIESEILNNAAVIITVSDYLTSYYKNKYASQAFTIYTGYEERNVKFSTNLLNKKNINIVYTGRISLSDSTRTIEPFIRLLNYVSTRKNEIKSKIKFHFAGDLSGREYDNLKVYLNNGVLKYWGILDKKQIYELQNSASILLLITDPIKKSVVTGKLFEYFSTKKPILAILPDNEARKIMKKSGYKSIFYFNDFNKIFKFIDSLVIKEQYVKHTKFFLSLKAKRQFYLLAKIIRNIDTNV